MGEDRERSGLSVLALEAVEEEATLSAEQAIAWAVQAGYKRMVLDALPTMTSAQRLYERLGFSEIAPYRFDPVRGARFMALGLTA